MTTKIIKANVIGKHQNRTALGMMAAFLAMHPEMGLPELRATFTKQDVCPDAGIDQLFYTPSAIEQEDSDWFKNGNACFIKDGEWLTLGNGRKIAFCKVWTSSSLGLLQEKMAQFDIYGEVGSVDKEQVAGYTITYLIEKVEKH